MSLQDIIALLKDAGAGVSVLLLICLWWMNDARKEERDERRKLQAERDQLFERFITATEAATAAVDAIKDMLRAGAKE